MRLFSAALLVMSVAMVAEANTIVYVSLPAEKKIGVYRLDAKDGALTLVEAFAVDGAPGAMCVDPAKKYLFASLRSIDALASYAIDAKTGKLTHLSTVLREKGGNAAHVNFDPKQNELISASYMAGNWMTHKVDKEGKINKDFSGRLVTAKTAHAMVLDPSAMWMFVPHVETNEILQYWRSDMGQFMGGSRARGGEPKAGPRHLAFHPTLKMAYSSNETGNSITAYSFDPKDGLSPRQTLSTLPADYKKPNTTAEVKVHPSGKFVWVSNRGHDSLAGFAIDDQGKLTAIGQTPTEKTPRSFEIEPDGRWIVGAGEGNGKVAVYRVDTDNGKLSRVHTYDMGKSVTWVMAVKFAS